MSEVRPSLSTSAAAAGMDGGVRPTLAHALNQTTEVREKIEGVGDELLIVNTVLKHEIPSTLQIGEVAQALEKHEALETIVQECVEDLAEVNEALEEEVTRREGLERQLAQSQAELARSQSAQGLKGSAV
jgi:chromosome segregation ATPase